jgi:hypothetical protein
MTILMSLDNDLLPGMLQRLRKPISSNYQIRAPEHNDFAIRASSLDNSFIFKLGTKSRSKLKYCSVMAAISIFILTPFH